jgi:hypothetical protein
LPRASHPEGTQTAISDGEAASKDRAACMEPYEWNVKLVWADPLP